ncbi:hypothetical protein FHT80_005233 [Rhizobium sp. BK226]|nr:hypothetical protein [Rhizobium sp. BK226]
MAPPFFAEPTTSAVILGLDPRIHAPIIVLAVDRRSGRGHPMRELMDVERCRMDPRVKPEDDGMGGNHRQNRTHSLADLSTIPP